MTTTSAPERIVGWLSRRMSRPERDAVPGPPRRSFLGGAALVGAAVATAPLDYLTRPASAYDSVCGSGNTCNDGWSVFCCTINGGQNSCPPNTFVGGWWKADNSSFCGGTARYYIDCNAFRNGAWSCRCNQTTCDQRLVACNQFRYGQCNTQVPWSNTGPVVCRVVSCTPPWVQFGGVCTSSSATDNNTATHSAPCLVPPDTLRIGVVDADDTAAVKTGSLWAPWTTLATGVAMMSVATNRVGVVGRDGVVRAKEGPVNAGWTVLADTCVAAAVGETRVAVLGADGNVRAKEGALNADWVLLADRATAFGMQAGRIAVVQNGVVSIKEGPLNSPWVRIGTGARGVVIDGFRTAVLFADGSVQVREGALDAPPVLLSTGTAAVSMSGGRIGVLGYDGRFQVKEGAVNAPWTLVAEGIVQAVVQGERIAVLDGGGTLRVKEGVISAGWVTERTGARGVVLS